ncbi:Restriction endonuclease [Paraburkholderia tropica]|uniref:restriction endonuclease n=1 Tax=Paraburkholderia tropica TaxID=92647 RepID=UPI001CB06806|nr:restriction endonuclease [Paraburkholderia tropica]CAG9223722.1 Restriction endonuclease [Paraburkholderia tropica]
MKEKSDAEYKQAIVESGKTIFDPIEIGDPDYWIPTLHLETLLNDGMRGKSLAGLALRTRSKVVKAMVCDALGYPVPQSFTKCQPRFFGQQLDTYAQKALNLQIWNEELSPTRRYAIIQVLEDDSIGRVRVVNGQQLAILDRTGTITTKYQARLELRAESRELVTLEDTPLMWPHINPGLVFSTDTSPVQEPLSGELRPIREVFERLSPLVGQTFADPGMDQERNRGAALHYLVCQALGYARYGDTGQFPDIKHQLLEIKLQTSPTIDLGLVEPTSQAPLDIQKLGRDHPRHCDTRYAIFYAITDGKTVTLTHLFVTTGEMFFTRFRQFGGKVINGKLQIPLPRDFFA